VEAAANFIVKPDFTDDDFEKLGNYCKELKLDHPKFTILTPLPGTDLYDEVKDSVSNNYDLYDLMHPVVPTYYPLKEFFDKYATLWETAWETAASEEEQSPLPDEQRKIYLAKAQELMAGMRNSYKDYSTE
jgi:radical SAM superfamily enzyme YgiQ (UPF0313 family)